MPVKAVLFDLDNTLYEYEKCNRAALEAVIGRLSAVFSKPKETVKEVFDQSRKKVKEWLKGTAASHSRFLYFQKTVETLKGSTDVKLTQDVHHLFWGTYFNEMELFDGVIDFLKMLKEAGIKIAIVSDLTVDTQFKKLSKLGIENYIDFVITSEEAGHDKPANPIFQLALEKLELQKDEIVLIGDDLKDVEGAKEMGFGYIQVDNNDFRSAVESFKRLNSL